MTQEGAPVYDDESECTHPEAVHWNPYNQVVQCHVCGRVYVAFSASPYSRHLVEALNQERQRANRLQFELDRSA